MADGYLHDLEINIEKDFPDADLYLCQPAAAPEALDQGIKFNLI